MSLFITSVIPFSLVAVLLFAQLIVNVHAWQQCESISSPTLDHNTQNKICPNDSSGTFTTCTKPDTIRDEFTEEHCKLDQNGADYVRDALFYNCKPLLSTAGPDCCLGAKSSTAALSLASATEKGSGSHRKAHLEFNFVVPKSIKKSLFVSLSSESPTGGSSEFFFADIAKGLLVKDCNSDITMRAGSFDLIIAVPNDKVVTLEIYDSTDSMNPGSSIWRGVFNVLSNGIFTSPGTSETVREAGRLVTTTPRAPKSSPIIPASTTTPSAAPTTTPTTTDEAPRLTVSTPTSETQTSSPTPTVDTSEGESMTVVYAAAGGGALLLLSLIAVCVAKSSFKKRNRGKCLGDSFDSHGSGMPTKRLDPSLPVNEPIIE